MNEIKDYYKKLNCTIDSSYRNIYLNFKKLAFPLHPENSTSHRNDNLFKEYCEAYYVLEYREFRNIYNKIYKRYFLSESNDLSEEEIDSYITTWKRDGLDSAEEYMRMSFNKFKRKIPRKDNWFGLTVDAIIRFISNV